MTLPPTQPCPYCEHPVRPGRKCWGCKREDPLDENSGDSGDSRADADNSMTLQTGEPVVSGKSPRTASVPDSRSALKDDRLEAKRKSDAREDVQNLGWRILDLEQGYRPFACPECDNRLPGGSRVPKGIADWCLMGHGMVAWIEWKSADGVQTKDQKKFEKWCDAAGVPYAVCRTTVEAVQFLRSLTHGRAA